MSMNAGWVFFLSLLGWALALMLLLPRLKAGSGLLCALCGMLFGAYVLVIVAGIMAPAAYGLMWGGVAGLAAGLAAVLLNWRDMRRRVLTPGLIAFGICAAAAVWLLRGVVIDDHDSLSYWMRIVRELFDFQRFPIHGDTTMAHTDYFPMLAALQYCVVRAFGWQDASLVYVTVACVLCALAALTDLLPKKGWGAAAAPVLLYAYCALGSPLFSTRADGPISALFAAGALCLFLREEESPTAWLPAFAVAGIMTGLKIYTGLMLSLVLCGSMALSVRGGAGADKALARKLTALSLGALALSLFMQLSWSGMYHYFTKTASYEAAQAVAAYTGGAAAASAPAFSLGDLFAGNPRNQSLLSSLGGGGLAAAEPLIRETLAAYAGSALPWLWLFLLPAVLLAALADRKTPGRVWGLLGAMATAALLYLLGLFASYLVQAETAGAAVNYLTTISTPMMLAAVFLVFRVAGGDRGAALGRAALPLAVAGMLVLTPPTALLRQFQFAKGLTGYGALAEGYFADEIADQLRPEDAGKHALLVDCTYEASEIKSESGVIHAYQYFGLPLRVHALLYPYGNYDLLDAVDNDSLTELLNQNRCDLLLLRVEDELYWEALGDALSLEGDWDEPVAVYDVSRREGELVFHCRLDVEPEEQPEEEEVWEE